MQDAKKNPAIVLLAGSAIALAVQAELRARAEELNVRVATPQDDDYAVLKEYCDRDVADEYLRMTHLKEGLREMKRAPVDPYPELYASRKERQRAYTQSQKRDRKRFKL